MHLIGTQIAHYLIEEKLGEGGMGVVYKAEDTILKRLVALKFLKPEALKNEKEKARFLREAQTAAALDHPNICTIFEINEFEGQTYIAMAYIEGQNLDEKMEQKPLKLEQALDIAIQMAEGLKEAHEKGVIHRDIKSANIMVTPKGQAKIMDFGLAKISDRIQHLKENRAINKNVGKAKLSGITKPGITMGTLAYMSPEQTRGEEVDHRTDIWALGIVLYETITGKLPFKGEYEQTVISSIMNDTPQQITSIRNEVSIELEHIISKALVKNRTERYQNAGEMLVDLKGIKNEFHSRISQKKSSIAVLPFVNMSADPENEYFCDGLAEELINTLTHVQNLRVIARASSFLFKRKNVDIIEIGKKLNVKTVLEGSVRMSGNRVRVTAQLIDVASNDHLWSEQYDREMKDIFTIQDELSLTIVDMLKVKLLGEEKAAVVKRYTKDLEAYNFYLKGQYFLHKITKEDLKKAIMYFEQAINKVPDYAQAYAGLAQSYFLSGLYDYFPQKDVFPKSKTNAEKALEIDSSLAEAHCAQGQVKLYYDWEWAAAEKHFKRAIELNPNNGSTHTSYAGYLGTIGRLDDAIKESEKALEVDPVSTIANAHVVIFLLRANMLEQAREQCRKTLELAPDHPITLWLLGQTDILDTRYDEGIATLQKAVKLSENKGLILAGLGWAYAISGQRSEAQQVLDLLHKRSRRSYLLAKIYSGMGDRDQAFAWLEKAYEEHDLAVTQIKTDEAIENLRSDPKFIELLKKLNLNK